MGINGIRFRMEGELCVLQISELASEYGYSRTTETWRDAKATDLLNVAKFTADYSALSSRVSQLERQRWDHTGEPT